AAHASGRQVYAACDGHSGPTAVEGAGGRWMTPSWRSMCSGCRTTRGSRLKSGDHGRRDPARDPARRHRLGHPRSRRRSARTAEAFVQERVCVGADAAQCRSEPNRAELRSYSCPAILLNDLRVHTGLECLWTNLSTSLNRTGTFMSELDPERVAPSSPTSL